MWTSVNYKGTKCVKIVNLNLGQVVWNCVPSCATHWKNSCDHHIHIFLNLTPSLYSKICQLSGYVWLSYPQFAKNNGKLPASTKNAWTNDEIQWSWNPFFFFEPQYPPQKVNVCLNGKYHWNRLDLSFLLVPSVFMR